MGRHRRDSGPPGRAYCTAVGCDGEVVKAPRAVAALLLGAMLLAACARSDERERPAPNSADRLIFWANCAEVVKLSDAQLDEWESRGIDGFVCVHQHLWGLGGSQRFDPRPGAPLAGEPYRLQRDLRDSDVVRRAKDRGMKMYLGFFLVNAQNNATPLLDWFDDRGWSQRVLPAIRDAAAVARLLEFDGVAFDQELYGRGEGAQNWPWDYPGNRRGEAQVRAQVKQRGHEVMRAVLDVFPGVDLLTYAYAFPGDWKSAVQEEQNAISGFGANSTFIDWYDGLSSAEGYSAIRLFSTAFYKVFTPARDWDTALAHEYNSIYSLFSRQLSNWSYAASRLHLSPAIWVDDGDPNAEGDYQAARPPEYVDAQLQAMRSWAAGRELVVFAYHGLYGTAAARYTDAFDYRPYVPSLRRASEPAVVDDEGPALALVAPTAGEEVHVAGTGVDLRGTASDNRAVRAVTWENDRGGGGAAQMRWQVRCGNHREGYESETAWAADGITLHPGTNNIVVTAEDVKGLRTTRHLRVVAGSGSPTPDTTAPVVRLASPGCASAVWGGIRVVAEASDNTGVAKVDFLVDGRVLSTAASPPYAWDWDTSTTGEGTVTLGVTAYDHAGNHATSSFPVTVQPSPSQFEVRRAAAPPVVDGRLAEYAGAPAATFGQPGTSSKVTVRALWDADNLYLAFDVEDPDVQAAPGSRDGRLWEEDSVEWFVDVRGDGGGASRPGAPYMAPDDHQGIVSAANVQFDARGTSTGAPDTSWDGLWTSRVVRAGPSAGGAPGYAVEISIPWTTLELGSAPRAGLTIGLGLALNDKSGDRSAAVMWPDVTTAFQNASKWPKVRLAAG